MVTPLLFFIFSYYISWSSSQKLLCHLTFHVLLMWFLSYGGCPCCYDQVEIQRRVRPDFLAAWGTSSCRASRSLQFHLRTTLAESSMAPALCRTGIRRFSIFYYSLPPVFQRVWLREASPNIFPLPLNVPSNFFKVRMCTKFAVCSILPALISILFYTCLSIVL